MMQSISTPATLTVMSAAPTLAGDGVDVTGGAGSLDFRRDKHLITVTLTGGTTLELVIYGLINGVWGILADLGNSTGLLGGAALATTATYHFEVDHVGVADRFAIAKGTEVGGTVTVVATIATVKERNR